MFIMLKIGRYIEMTTVPTRAPTNSMRIGSRMEVSDLTDGVDLVLVEVGDLAEHRVQGARLLADGDHLRDHRPGTRGTSRSGSVMDWPSLTLLLRPSWPSR